MAFQTKLGVYPVAIFFIVILVLLLILWDTTSLNNLEVHHLQGSSHPRLLQYCSKQQYLGAENSLFEGKAHFRLKNLVITIRHGDRSAIHQIPGINKVEQQRELLEPEATRYTPHLSALSLRVLGQSIEPIVSLVMPRILSRESSKIILCSLNIHYLIVTILYDRQKTLPKH